MKKYRVIIVEDDIHLRSSLVEWLSQDYDALQFQSAEDFLQAINEFNFEDDIPTCIVLDFQMPGMTGVALQEKLKLLNIDHPIIFISGNAHQIDIIDAWRGGAIDFLLKPFSGTQISNLLDIQFSKLLTPKHLKSTQQEKLIDIPITKREAEVLLLLGSGKQQIEVAEILGISIRTVKMYRSFLKDKLELNTLGELTRYSMEHENSIKKVANQN